jgi:hypothetical protein
MPINTLTSTLRLFLLLFTVSLLSACGVQPPPAPDPLTKHYQTDTVLTNAQISTSKPADLKRHKILVVRMFSFPVQNEYFMQAIRNQNIFEKVLTPNALALSDQIRSDENLMELASSNLGLKILSKNYGNFLVLEIHEVARDFHEDFYFKLFDPANNDVYFSGHYSSHQILWIEIYNPFFNALADWVKQSQNAFHN